MRTYDGNGNLLFQIYLVMTVRKFHAKAQKIRKAFAPFASLREKKFQAKTRSLK